MKPSSRRWLWPLLVVMVALVLGARDWMPSPQWQDLTRVDLINPARCEPAVQPCFAIGDQTRVSYAHAGASALETFAVRVGIDGLPAAQAVQVIYDMPGMEMGKNEFTLSQAATGEWQGEAVLPVCVTGKREWQAEVIVAAGSFRYHARFPFTLAQ